MATVTCEIQWLVYLLQDFKIHFEQLSLLYCDNDSARYIATNPIFHECTKDIEINCYIVREKLKKKSHPFASHFYHRAISRHLYQSLRSSVFQEYLFQVGSHQHSLPSLGGVFRRYGYKVSRRKLILCDFVFMKLMIKSNYHQLCLFVFMALSNCNIFIYFLYLAILRMGYITCIYSVLYL